MPEHPRISTNRLRQSPEDGAYWTIVWLFDHLTGWCMFQQATRIVVR